MKGFRLFKVGNIDVKKVMAQIWVTAFVGNLFPIGVIL
jgi:hypothetical protein